MCLNGGRTPTRPGSGAVAPCASSWPTTPPVKSETYTLDGYVKLWEGEHCRKLSAQELETLKHGCIGVTALNIGTNGNPPLDNAYATLKQAEVRAKEMEKKCAGAGKKPRIFSKRFWSDGESYAPDPKTGKVDMSGYKYKAQPGYTNFDYGFYDEKSASWWHANHFDDPKGLGPMKVYRSTIEYYSRPLSDFDRQIFGVACGTP